MQTYHLDHTTRAQSQTITYNYERLVEATEEMWAFVCQHGWRHTTCCMYVVIRLEPLPCILQVLHRQRCTYDTCLFQRGKVLFLNIARNTLETIYKWHSKHTLTSSWCLYNRASPQFVSSQYHFSAFNQQPHRYASWKCPQWAPTPSSSSEWIATWIMATWGGNSLVINMHIFCYKHLV